MATPSNALAGKSYGQRIPVGCNLWGHKESNMTEHMHTQCSRSGRRHGGVKYHALLSS